MGLASIPYSFWINLNEAATLVSQGALIMTSIQNLVFSVYLVIAFRKYLDGFKLAIDALLLLRVLTLTPNTLADKLIVGLLISNRLVAAAVDLIKSPSRRSPTSGYENCEYLASAATGWWYISSDIACDLYATFRNYAIMSDAERAVGRVPFFAIYRNWNVSRSMLVLATNVTVGVVTVVNRLDRSVYIMACSFQFIILSYLMTYDMTLIKTAENAKVAGNGSMGTTSEKGGDTEGAGTGTGTETDAA
ncbi:hypothetical protein HDU96_000449 [Phlyctochytrium bullatum]|nr:hypothetical protein HDU96_000449 [Phlyctochytrium bullatum]